MKPTRTRLGRTPDVGTQVCCICGYSSAQHGTPARPLCATCASTKSQEERALQALTLLIDAVIDSVAVGGTDGAPGGVLYAAMMGQVSLSQFEDLMRFLVAVGKLTKRGDLYFAVNPQSVSCEACDDQCSVSEAEGNQAEYGVAICDRCVEGGLECGALPLGAE
jgi:hypothetical protein